MGGLPRDGDMVAVRADEARVRALIAPYAADVAIAAVNGPAESVISGRTAAVDAACRDLERQGIAVQRLNVSHAFHSPLMDPILGGIEGVASEVAWKPPAISLISLVTGTAVGLAEIGSGAYWRNQARAPVRFADGMAALSGAGIDAFVEIGPHPVLLGMGRRCLPNAQALWLPSLRRDRDGWQTFQAALGALWVRGAPVVWEGLDRGALRRRVALPTYPFQRTRHWFDHGRATVAAQADARPAITANGRGSRAADRPAGHPLLGTRLASPLAERQFVSRLDAAALPYIADHRVNGRPILPAAAFVELVLAAAEQVDPGARWAVEDLVIHAPLAFEGPTGARPAAEAACQVQTIVVDAGGATRTVRVFARRVDVGSDEGWTLHATARAVAGPSDGQDPAAASAFAPLDDIRSRCREGVTAAAHRAQLRSRGLDFGPSLHGVVDIRRRDGEALGQVRLTEAVAGEADRYRIHPAWLDACLQVVAAALPREPHDATPYFPLAVDRIRVLRAPEAEVLCHVRLRAPDAAPRRGLQEGPATSVGGAPIEDIVPAPASLTSDVTILDARGSPIATITGLQLVRSSRAPRAGAMPEAIPDWLYTIAWRLAPPAAAEVAAAASPTSVDPIDLAGRLAPRLSTLAAEHGLDAHRDLVEHLGTVVAVYVRRAFARLGWVPRPDEATTADRLVERLGIQPRYRRLVERLLAGLAADERE
ncbi:MAG: polyketide synthase, partial [Chloroflexi bacterium CFX6]|nr:polyketide synthase [Chloroflexi bacterium CFX6]